MAIAGVSVNSSISSFQNRQEAQQTNAAGSGRAQNSVSQSATTGSTEVVTQAGSQVTTTSATPIQPPTQSNQTTTLQTSRRNPADTEATANQFRLQRESTQGNQAVQQFVSVANFEQRDSLASQTGIDIFV
jgi:hypothetical protein